MAWRGPAAWSSKEQRGGDRLPYSRHVDDMTLQLRDGSLMRVLHLNGLSFETEDADHLNHTQAVRETILRSTLDARFIVYHHVIRRRVSAELPAHYADAFSGHLHEKWSNRLAKRTLFANELFLTIMRRPPRGKTGLLERLRKRFNRDGRDAVDPEELRDLDSAVMGLSAALQQYGVRDLACYQGEGGLCSEPLEFLAALYNGEMRPVLKPDDDVDLGHHIPYKRLSFGLDTIEYRGAGGPEFAAMICIKDYPGEARVGILDDVLRLPHEFVLTESYAPVDRQVARERIDLSLRRLKSTDEDVAGERREMLAAKDQLVGGQIGFGIHHLSLSIRASDMAGLDKAAAKAVAALADFGSIGVREDVNLEPSFWAQFPGNENYIARGAMISTPNAASFVSMHGFPMGQLSGNHWGDAITIFETTSSTPYFFNFHEGDLGHFSIIGPSGSGKTVVMNFLTAQAQKLQPRTILFDKDRGAEIFLRALGGNYVELRPGFPTGFNPLRLPDTQVNRAFLRDWLSCLLAPSQGPMLPADETVIAAAVDANYEQSLQLRTLRHFGELLGGTKRPEEGDLQSRLRPWLDHSDRGWVFDNDDDQLDLSNRVIGFDMTALLDQPAIRTAVMMYLFHRVDERLDGSPAMIMIDEGWKVLDDPVFAARLRDWLKTLRKRNAIVGFGTQSARDALDSKVASAIVEQTATQIFMPNSRARADDYCTGFGLSDHELALIRALPVHSRCFLIRKPNHSVVVRLDLGQMPDMLTILSGRESTVRQLDILRQNHGDSPDKWYAQLTNTPWPSDSPTDPNMSLDLKEFAE
jgi:type IV secretion system protein VirB4